MFDHSSAAQGTSLRPDRTIFDSDKQNAAKKADYLVGVCSKELPAKDDINDDSLMRYRMEDMILKVQKDIVAIIAEIEDAEADQNSESTVCYIYNTRVHA